MPATNHNWLMGIEAEFHLLQLRMARVLELVPTHRLNGISTEFFQSMIEVISDPFPTPEQAVTQLRARVERLETVLAAYGAGLAPFASQPHGLPNTSWSEVTGTSDYYRWVYDYVSSGLGKAPTDLHHVGVHISYSHPALVGDTMIHAANWLRTLTWLFVLVTANSPFHNGQPSGALSRRWLEFPNRHDVPFWESDAAFRHWIAGEEAAGRIYRGKGRCWMATCPRFVGNAHTAPYERLELRPLEGGRGIDWDLLTGCLQLGQRIIEQSQLQPRLSMASSLECWINEQAVARHGRSARIQWDGQLVSAADVAADWCRGIPALEQVLDPAYGSPAERSLRLYHAQA